MQFQLNPDRTSMGKFQFSPVQLGSARFSSPHPYVRFAVPWTPFGVLLTFADVVVVVADFVSVVELTNVSTWPPASFSFSSRSLIRAF